MNTEKKRSEYEELMQYLEEAQAYETALILFKWDEETLAPEEAGSRTARMQGVLSSSYQRIMMSERVKELVDKCLQELTGEELQKYYQSLDFWDKLYEMEELQIGWFNFLHEKDEENLRQYVVVPVLEEYLKDLGNGGREKKIIKIL